jgi:hypothetical protein
LTNPTKDAARAQAMRSWEKLSNPKVLQQNLVLAGLYLAAYELLRGSIVDRLRNFFSAGSLKVSPRGTLVGTPAPEYSTRVLALYPRDVFQASCLCWWRVR